jgi:hypothetical protein
MPRAAFSVHQPYAERILRGTKKYEYRSKPTLIRGRVYVYATLKGPMRLPRGRILGTVEVIACEWSSNLRCYRWKLSAPRRIRPRIPKNHPQPVWFYPFTLKKNAIAKPQRHRDAEKRF